MARFRAPLYLTRKPVRRRSPATRISATLHPRLEVPARHSTSPPAGAARPREDAVPYREHPKDPESQPIGQGKRPVTSRRRNLPSQKAIANLDPNEEFEKWKGTLRELLDLDVYGPGNQEPQDLGAHPNF